MLLTKGEKISLKLKLAHQRGVYKNSTAGFQLGHVPYPVKEENKKEQARKSGKLKMGRLFALLVIGKLTITDTRRGNK